MPHSERWYAHPNDLIGGWSILTHDGPPSELDGSNGREVATFVFEADARRIADLHNADQGLGDPSLVAGEDSGGVVAGSEVSDARAVGDGESRGELGDVGGSGG
jgi:hypothetical protein